MRDRQLRHFRIRWSAHLVLMLEIILAGGDEFARPRHRRKQSHIAGREDDLLAARASNRFALLLGKEQRLMGGVESKSAGRNEILRIRRRHRMRERQCTIEREFARQQSGAGAFDVDDIAVGENEAETLDSRCRCESDEAHVS